MHSVVSGMGIEHIPNDESGKLFSKGMKKDAQDLGDPVADEEAAPSTWDAPFMVPQKIHGVVLVAGNSAANVKNKLFEVRDILEGLVKEIVTVDGKVRPGDMRAHEQ